MCMASVKEFEPVVYYPDFHLFAGDKFLTQLINYHSLTDAIAMDCEMVGVGQGNKSALGRVTLVFIGSSCCILYVFVFLSITSIHYYVHYDDL